VNTTDAIPGFVDENFEACTLKYIGKPEEKERGQIETALDDPYKPFSKPIIMLNKIEKITLTCCIH
jgi:hypothetical protein